MRIVSNAGGLNPAGLADRLREVARASGSTPRSRTSRATTCASTGLREGALTANAYLGGFGIAAALTAGADVVVTGRVTDASLVVGPAVAAPRLDARVSTTSWPVPSWPATSSSAVPRPPAATSAASSTSTRSRPLGFPIAEIAADGSERDHQARRHRRRRHRRHGHRPAALRDPVDPLPRPRRDRRPHLISLGQAGTDRVAVTGVTRRGAAGAAQGLRQRARRLPQLRRVRAHRARRRGEGGVGARRSSAAALDPARPRSSGRRSRSRRSTPTPRRAPRCCCGAPSRTPRPTPVGKRVHRRRVELALGSYPGFT